MTHELVMKQVLMYRDRGAWTDVIREADAVLAHRPDYSDAHREKGIAENKLWVSSGSPAGMATGVGSLLKAIALSPRDYDTHASLGGALKRTGRRRYAWVAYRRAARVSRGHPYPLLNKIKLEAHLERRLVIDHRLRFQLGRAERMRAAEAGDNPPAGAWWGFFDLAEMRLYAGDREQAIAWMNEGIRACHARWQAETCRQSLLLLQDVTGIDGSLLSELADALKQAEERLPA